MKAHDAQDDPEAFNQRFLFSDSAEISNDDIGVGGPRLSLIGRLAVSGHFRRSLSSSCEKLNEMAKMDGVCSSGGEHLALLGVRRVHIHALLTVRH